jgi:hypothetical protein
MKYLIQAVSLLAIVSALVLTGCVMSEVSSASKAVVYGAR